MISGLLKKIFGSRNDRLVRQYMHTVRKINALEAEISALSDEALRGKTAEFRERGIAINGLWPRTLFMLAGVVACAFATALYVGAQLGPGPRDGLMTGLTRRSGWPLRRVRTLIELGALAVGVLLGGTVGVGTVVFAFGVGPLTQWFLRGLVVRLEPRQAGADRPGAAS